MAERRTIAWRVLFVLALVLAPLARGPWRGAEQLVANASSPSWARRLAVWSTDAARAGDEPAAWYAASSPITRRFARWVPSALMSLEIAVFGARPWAVRLVTLLFHLGVCWLGLGLLARGIGDHQKAAAATLLVGLHGAVFEVIAWESCQAIVVAAFFSLSAARLMLASRAPGRARPLFAAGAVLFALLAMTSYEAAVVVPLVLLLLDRALLEGGPTLSIAPRAPRWVAPVLLALYPLYGVLVWASTQGSTHASYRAAPLEAAMTVLQDGTRYIAATALWLPTVDRLLARLPQVAVAAAALVALVAVALLLHSTSSTRWRSAAAAVAIYALFLAPPLLARATVSVLNRPSMRQIYLPLIGVAILLALVGATGGMSRRCWIAVTAVIGLAAVASLAVFVRNAPPPAYERLRASVRRELEHTDPDRPILVIGRAVCAGRWGAHEYRVEYDAGPRLVIPMLPLGRDERPPSLQRANERTVEASTSAGFAIDIVARQTPRGRAEHRPPPIADVGTQRTPFGRVDVAARDEQAGIRQLRITLDRPIAAYTFLVLDGCSEARRIEIALPPPAPLPAAPQ